MISDNKGWIPIRVNVDGKLIMTQEIYDSLDGVECFALQNKKIHANPRVSGRPECGQIARQVRTCLLKPGPSYEVIDLENNGAIKTVEAPNLQVLPILDGRYFSLTYGYVNLG